MIESRGSEPYYWFSPHMTGEDSPEQYHAEASNSSGGGLPPWGLFDGNTSTFWACVGAGGPHWVSIRFPKPTIIRKIKMGVRNGYPSQIPLEFILQGSTDGVVFKDLASFTSRPSNYIWELEEDVKYQHYRFYNMRSSYPANNNAIGISEIEFYTRDLSDADAETFLNQDRASELWAGMKRLYLPGDGMEMSGYVRGIIGGPDIYSKEEVLIGQWLDGEPLYRKCFTGTMASDINTGWTQIHPLIPDIQVKRIDGVIDSDDFTEELQAETGKGHTRLLYLKRSTTTAKGMTGICTYTESTAFTGKPVIVFLEYTKTID